MDDEIALLPYVCRECGKRYATSPGLNGHMMSHRPPVHCPECGKEYRSVGALGNHRKHVHGVESANSKVVRPRHRPDTTWQVGDIFTAVLAILYPNGVLPIEALPALLEWRDDTQRMLEKVARD